MKKLLSLVIVIIITMLSCNKVEYAKSEYDYACAKIKKVESKYPSMKNYCEDLLTAGYIEQSALQNVEEDKVVEIYQQKVLLMDNPIIDKAYKLEEEFTGLNSHKSTLDYKISLEDAGANSISFSEYRDIQSKYEVVSEKYYSFLNLTYLANNEIPGQISTMFETITALDREYSNVIDKIDAVNDRIERAKKAEKKRLKELEEQLNKKQQEQNNTTIVIKEETKEKKKEPKQVTVKCDYCGNSNTFTIKDGASYKCNGCGAPQDVN